MERYLSDLLPTFPQLQNLDKEFMPFYLCGAVRKVGHERAHVVHIISLTSRPSSDQLKFFFVLDPLRRGKVAISQILLSPILSEFFELQQPDLQQPLLLSNWFSLQSAMRVYSQYVDLDVDRNGMLGYAELLKYNNGRYTEAFIQRVFQECQTFGGEMVGVRGGSMAFKATSH